MPTKTINWDKGGGTFKVTYDGSGNGTILVTSDANTLHEARSQSLTVKTTKGGTVEKTITVAQAMKPYIDLSNAVVTAANQTYSGSALTPTPTVKLNGVTVPSTGYDVTYSNNTNAGTATITITGKGDYAGTATGTFTIAKANPTYTAPVASTNLTYNGSSRYLTTAGSTSHGTIYYSLDGTNWYTTRRTRTNAGTYTSYWKLTGDANHNDVASTAITTTIAKASGSVTTAPTAKSVTYNGSSQALINAGSGTGTMYYRYKLSTSSTWSSWSTSVPSRTDAGTYNIEYYAAASTNYEQSSIGSLNVTMAKADGYISIAPTAKTLYYTGSAQTVANAGSGSGSMYYRLGTSGSYSTTIPTATNAGDYTLYYYAAASTNYKQSSTSSITIHMASSTYSYVSDGLIHMWDGKENTGRLTHASSPAAWQDLVGSLHMTRNAACTFDSDGFVVSGQWKAATIPGEATGVWFIEIVCKSTKDKTSQLVFNGRSREASGGAFAFSNGFSFRANGQVNFTNSGSAIVVNDHTVARTYSSSPGGGETDNTYVNGVKQTDIVSGGAAFATMGNNGVSCSTNSVSLRAGNYPFYGKIYCIRLYNRALTESEVAANYAIDKERFGV